MDGNGRWANARGIPRAAGHERGVEALRRTVEAAREIGLKYLTVFSFSTENWRRPVTEVNALFALLKAYVKRDLERLKREGVCIRILGHRNGVPEDVAALIAKAEQDTANNTNCYLNIAFNYGGREEIVRGIQSVVADIRDGKLNPEDLNEVNFSQYLDTTGQPDPDLLIRTSGEFRLSNFLLWQAAYAELVFTDVLWPDFGREHLLGAIEQYKSRERRFGAVTPGGK
ncbi:UNVERIFIED_CONTAM: hypothetical protein GTU68_025450 [Idotea baltica]|nr:hypothetical protein [Idotea baltica]